MTHLIPGLHEAKLDALNLPYDLTISTATITCKLDVMFDVINIAYYFNDFDDIIIGKRYGDRVINNLINIKKLKTGKKKKRKEKKNFFNQVSLIFRTATLMGIDPNSLSLKEKFKNINVKLFINGSIQMTGCKNFDNIKKCLEILFEKLKITKAILNKDMIFEKKPFVRSIENLYLFKQNIDPNNFLIKVFDNNILNIKNIYNFEIRMINTNFNIGFQINRHKLHLLLLEAGHDASFDPIIHACVNIKYYISELDKTISIFVFESGSITIAGSNSCYQILKTYNFINKFILSNYNKLLSKTITPQIIIGLIHNI